MPEMKLQDLKAKSPVELLAFAEELKVENASTLRKQELMFAILKQLAAQETDIIGEGVVEVLQDGFGFLRSPEANYLAGPDDIYVSPSQIRRFSLRTGDTVEGQIRGPKDGERYFALLKVNSINFEDPEQKHHKIHFDNLTPLYPNERFVMELENPTGKDMSARIMDLVSPLGKGQRALIVSPPRTGKTVLLQNIAHSIAINHPECYLIVLLIDERPEEVTDMQRSVRARSFPPPSTSRQHATSRSPRWSSRGQAPGRARPRRGHPARFDHAPRPRLQHRRAVIGQGAHRRCRRQRAAAPKRFFGAARNIEEGGSLTIISTALIDTGSRMDEVIFEEFKGTGNSKSFLTARSPTSASSRRSTSPAPARARKSFWWRPTSSRRCTCSVASSCRWARSTPSSSCSTSSSRPRATPTSSTR